MSNNTQSIELKDLVAHIIKEVKKELAEDRKQGTDFGDYTVEIDSDGMLIGKQPKPILLLSKDKKVGIGTKSPRTVTNGSTHIKAGNGSQGVIPSAGQGSTRGLLVEGDGDDQHSFSFRAMSKQNRQGLNVGSDGSLFVGTMEKRGVVTLYNKGNDASLSIEVPSKTYNNTILQMATSRVESDEWNGIELTANSDRIFAVSGKGHAYTNETYHTNRTGYAEMFEWSDKNPRNEDRTGMIVALDGAGKLVIATETDEIVGVVVANPAVIGNSSWNRWDKKFRHNTEKYSVTEWITTETSLLVSEYSDDIKNKDEIPLNAVTTDGLSRNKLHREYNNELEYIPRVQRKEWSAVCLLGRAPVLKGQVKPNTWITVESLSNEYELVIIK